MPTALLSYQMVGRLEAAKPSLARLGARLSPPFPYPTRFGPAADSHKLRNNDTEHITT